MSEKDFRPRLDNLELRFLIHALRGYAKTLQDEVSRLDYLPYEVKKLAWDCWCTGDRELLKVFRRKKAELPSRWRRMMELHDQAVICKDLARRFEATLNGTYRKPGFIASFCLEKLLVPEHP